MEFKKFKKEERSSFRYWFEHYKAFNYVAWKLNVWKPKWLLHDIEKPWLKLIWDYKKLQTWHRHHNNHHIQYGRMNGLNKVDWLAAVIDWECARYTKIAQPRNAREEANALLDSDKITTHEKEAIIVNVLPILDYLGL